MSLRFSTAVPRVAALAACAFWLSGCVGHGPHQRGQYFQYASTDGKVVAEYDAHDAATCAQHLKNMRQNNTHGSDSLRCASTSASGTLPVQATAGDGRGKDFDFRFETLEQCQRMLPAITTGGTVSRQCF